MNRGVPADVRALPDTAPRCAALAVMGKALRLRCIRGSGRFRDCLSSFSVWTKSIFPSY